MKKARLDLAVNAKSTPGYKALVEDNKGKPTRKMFTFTFAKTITKLDLLHIYFVKTELLVVIMICYQKKKKVQMKNGVEV